MFLAWSNCEWLPTPALIDRWKQRIKFLYWQWSPINVISPRPQNVWMTMTDSVPVKSQALFFALQNTRMNIRRDTKYNQKCFTLRFHQLLLIQVVTMIKWIQPTRGSHWNIEIKAWRPCIIYKDVASTNRGLSSLIYFIQVAEMVGLTEEPTWNYGFR